jgi:nondiscriminating glutamyl-tRNA synthetase
MYFNDEFDFENEEAAEVLKAETVPTVIGMLLEELPKMEVLDGAAVKALFKTIQKTTKLKGKDVFMPIRVALTGNQHGPELAEMIPLLGIERSANRVKASLAKAGITL